MIVRAVEPRDLAVWIDMRIALWPDENADDMKAEAAAHFEGRTLYPAIFVADDDGALVGFVEAGVRPYADGCHSSPVPFVEGWYVAPQARQRGVGRALVAAVEQWARAQGYSELASDALLENTLSHTAHGRLGFEEVERLVAFRKPLR